MTSEEGEAWKAECRRITQHAKAYCIEVEQMRKAELAKAEEHGTVVESYATKLSEARAEVGRLREATPNAKLAAEVERLREQLMAYSETAAQRDALLQENARLTVEIEKLRAQAGWDRLRSDA